MIEFYVIDTETTGLNSEYNEITEISIIRCKDRVQLTQFIKCDYPERASLDALKISNKSLNDLQNGNSKLNVINKINSFLNEDKLTSEYRCFIAHNYSFDKKFMHALYNKVNQLCPVDLWLCTMALFKSYTRKMQIIKPKINLAASCALLGIKKNGTPHSSKSDTRNTYMLWQKLVNDHQIDYLPFIKNHPHIVKTAPSDIDTFDMADVE